MNSGLSRNLWDEEYSRRGIPSSFRTSPSGVVVWAMDNWGRLTSRHPEHGLDVGCGAGRNLMYLASRGINMVGIDSSSEATRNAKQLVEHSLHKDKVSIQTRDLREGLPCNDGAVDVVLDTFVYFHLTNERERSEYRAELRRVVHTKGLVVLSLATSDDEYYAKCPEVSGWQESSNVPLVVDPIAGIANVLFDLPSFISEFEETFQLYMLWQKNRLDTMHGRVFRRATLGTIWGRR